MIRSAPEPEAARNESLYQGITTWAAHADRPLLATMLILGLAGAPAVVLLDWRIWPAAALLITVSTVAAWGLIEQQVSSRRSFAVSAAQWLLVAVGTITAVLASFGLLFWLMGPAPIL